MYPGVKMYFVAPDVCRMKDDIKQYLSSINVDWEEADDLKVREGEGGEQCVDVVLEGCKLPVDVLLVAARHSTAPLTPRRAPL